MPQLMWDAWDNLTQDLLGTFASEEEAWKVAEEKAAQPQVVPIRSDAAAKAEWDAYEEALSKSRAELYAATKAAFEAAARKAGWTVNKSVDIATSPDGKNRARLDGGMVYLQTIHRTWYQEGEDDQLTAGLSALDQAGGWVEYWGSASQEAEKAAAPILEAVAAAAAKIRFPEHPGYEYREPPEATAYTSPKPERLGWASAARALWVAADKARAARKWREMRNLAQRARAASGYSDPLARAIFAPEMGEEMKALAEEGLAIPAFEASEARKRVEDEMKAHAKRMRDRRKAEEKAARQARRQRALEEARRLADTLPPVGEKVETTVRGHYRRGKRWMTAKVGDVTVLVTDPDGGIGRDLSSDQEAEAVIRIMSRLPNLDGDTYGKAEVDAEATAELRARIKREREERCARMTAEAIERHGIRVLGEHDGRPMGWMRSGNVLEQVVVYAFARDSSAMLDCRRRLSVAERMAVAKDVAKEIGIEVTDDQLDAVFTDGGVACRIPLYEEITADRVIEAL